MILAHLVIWLKDTKAPWKVVLTEMSTFLRFQMDRDGKKFNLLQFITFFAED